MLSIFDATGTGLVRRNGGDTNITDKTVWVDLLIPTPEEDALVEKLFGIDIPTRDEAREIEVSNRLYYENGAHYMTALIVYNTDQPIPSKSTITFILAKHRLITVRYYEPKAIPAFVQKAEKGEAVVTCGPTAMIGLIETLINRTADLTERVQDNVDDLAQDLFSLKGGEKTRSKRLDIILKNTGRYGDVLARAQESAHTIDRLMLYAITAMRQRGDEDKIAQRAESARHDVGALLEHMRFLTIRVTFLLDGVLGMISIEQNQIIKLFSVMAVMLMPPTLVASIYGMNFEFMPELKWLWGYPMAIGLMFVSGIIPFIYFKRKGWL